MILKILLLAGMFGFLFWAARQESDARREEYVRRHFAACFILPDGRIYQVEAGEIFIGTGKNADLKLGIPGADRGEYRGCLWGIKPLHVQVCAREDGWFYIRNLTDTHVLTKIGQTKEVLLEGDSERKLLHGMNINFGTYQITFYRGVYHE